MNLAGCCGMVKNVSSGLRKYINTIYEHELQQVTAAYRKESTVKH